MSDAALPAGESRPEHPRWLLPVIGAGIIALVVASNTGNAVWARWIIDNPYGLLALNSSNKYLIGTSPNTAIGVVLVLSTLRLMAPDPLFYAVGYLYRDRALHWARNVFPASGQIFELFEEESGLGGNQRRLLDVLVFVMPNNPVCLLAGVAAMDRVRFAVLAVTGTVARILLMRGIGWVFQDQIEAILDTVAQYQRWLTIASVVLVAGYVLWQVRSRRGLIGGVEELEEELGD